VGSDQGQVSGPIGERGSKGLRRLEIAAFTLLTVYTLLMIYLEARFSQDFVRNYFSDVIGPRPFYAVNSVLSLSLMISTGVLFLVAFILVDGLRGRGKAPLFYASQVVMFVYFALDELFMIHELAGLRFGFNDAFYILGLGFVEIIFVVWLGELGSMGRRARRLLVTGVVLFAGMWFVDAYAPKRAFLRLSFEDLFKLWAIVFFFMWALQICRDRIEDLKRASGAWGPRPT
jgi:hypothetical protein